MTGPEPVLTDVELNPTTQRAKRKVILLSPRLFLTPVWTPVGAWSPLKALVALGTLQEYSFLPCYLISTCRQPGPYQMNLTRLSNLLRRCLQARTKIMVEPVCYPVVAIVRQGRNSCKSSNLLRSLNDICNHMSLGIWFLTVGPLLPEKI